MAPTISTILTVANTQSSYSSYYTTKNLEAGIFIGFNLIGAKSGDSGV